MTQFILVNSPAPRLPQEVEEPSSQESVLLATVLGETTDMPT